MAVQTIRVRRRRLVGSWLCSSSMSASSRSVPWERWDQTVRLLPGLKRADRGWSVVVVEGDGGWEVSGTTLTTCQQSDALAAATDSRCDVAGSQPVVVGLDPGAPERRCGLLDVDDGGDHGILLRRCFTVEEAQDRTVCFHGERAVVAAGHFPTSDQRLVEPVALRSGRSDGQLADIIASSAVITRCTLILVLPGAHLGRHQRWFGHQPEEQHASIARFVELMPDHLGPKRICGAPRMDWSSCSK
jgi:hypothetical protein